MKMPPPLPGESASGFVLRLSRFLSADLARPLRGIIGDQWATASVIHRSQLVEILAEVSGLPAATLEPLFALSQVPGPFVKLGEFMVRPAHVDQSCRRIAPAVFASDAEGGRPLYHRLTWSLAHLKKDPDTDYPLISACDRCHAPLRWNVAFDVGQCDACTRRLWIAPSGRTDEGGVLDKLLQDLFCSSVGTRARARSALPTAIRAWPEGDILDLLYVIEAFAIAVARRFDVESCRGRLDAGNAILSGEDAIRRMVRAPIESALRDGSRIAPIAASGATTAYLRRSPSKAVSDYLLSLVA